MPLAVMVALIFLAFLISVAAARVETQGGRLVFRKLHLTCWCRKMCDTVNNMFGRHAGDYACPTKKNTFPAVFADLVVSLRSLNCEVSTRKHLASPTVCSAFFLTFISAMAGVRLGEDLRHPDSLVHRGL